MEEGFIGTGRVTMALSLEEAAVVVGLHFLKADGGHIQMIESMGEDFEASAGAGGGNPITVKCE
jgi:hypothetical protein